jgi:hypothetical protein
MEPEKTTTSNAILTAVFAGIAATLLSFVYYLIFKDVTGFPYSRLINVSSLIFIINIIFLVIGFIYYMFIKLSKRADLAFIICMCVLTALGIWGALGIHRADNGMLNTEFHELLIGLILIIGVTAFAGMPILYHNKAFNREVI